MAKKIPDTAEAVSRARFILGAVYRIYGPRLRGRVVPPADFAALSRREVTNGWDFTARHLMHRVAKAIVGLDELPPLRSPRAPGRSLHSRWK